MIDWVFYNDGEAMRLDEIQQASDTAIIWCPILTFKHTRPLIYVNKRRDNIMSVRGQSDIEDGYRYV